MAKLITRTFESNVYTVMGIKMDSEKPEIINVYISADTEKEAKKAFQKLYGTTPASVKFDHVETEMYGLSPELFKFYGTPLDIQTRKPLDITAFELEEEKNNEN